MCSPVVIILLNSVWSLIKIRVRLIWTSKLQSSHVEHGNSLIPRILSSVAEWFYASSHNHLPSLCSMACVLYSKERRCIICSKPAKGGQWEHIHLFSGILIIVCQCSVDKFYMSPSVNNSISTNFVSLHAGKMYDSNEHLKMEKQTLTFQNSNGPVHEHQQHKTNL